MNIEQNPAGAATGSGGGSREHVITMQDLDSSALITNPTPGDRQRLIDRLSRGFFPRIVSTEEPVACWSNFHLNGVVAPVYSSEAKAREMARAAAAAYEVETDVARVSGLGDFLLLCAECGYEGAILDDYYPVTFFNRLADMDRSRPTLMWMRFPDSTNQIYGFFFSRTGLVDPPNGSTVKWVRYEVLDKASRRFVLHEDPIPEQLDAHVITGPLGVDVIFPNGATFLGPYVSDIGAIAVFSTASLAAQFARKHGLLPPDASQPWELPEGYRIERVQLRTLLDRVGNQHGPLVDIGLNPLAHRFRQGWFFQQGDSWCLQTIAGIWDVTEDGIGQRRVAIPHKRYLGDHDDSDLSAHGRKSVVQLPFKRLLGADRSPIPEDDAISLIDCELAATATPMEMGSSISIPADAFVIDAFDKITGDPFASSAFDDSQFDLGFLIFPDFVAACAYLIHEVVPHDERVRLNGYKLCHGGGSPGSGNLERERQITMGLVTAMKKTLQDALVRGYTPAHARHVMRLMQDATATCEVTDIGYFGDLLFFGQADGGAIEERIVIDDPEEPAETLVRQRRLQSIAAQRRSIASALQVDPAATARLRTALQDSFSLMAEDSVVIAATALEEFAKAGIRTGYDYAGISMKLAKLVERELGNRLFKSWRDSARAELGKTGLAAIREAHSQSSSGRTETTLADFLDKRVKLDLGAMRFALAAAGDPSTTTPMATMLRAHLATLADGTWLSGDSLQSLLSDISTKYRNGGVHEHIVSFAVCREAMDRILLGSDPMLKRVLIATTPREKQ